jgi:NitT/TauT family transport system ATP-binding protein
MFQAEALLPWLTARGNVAFGLELRGSPKREAAARAEAWLERVGLAGFGERYPKQLSGGMKKRVARHPDAAIDGERAARCVVGRPQIRVLRHA